MNTKEFTERIRRTETEVNGMWKVTVLAILTDAVYDVLERLERLENPPGQKNEGTPND